MTMGCPTRLEMLDAVNGIGDAARIQEHVETCAACRPVYDGLKGAADVLSSTPYAGAVPSADLGAGARCLSDSQIIAFVRRRLPVEREEAVADHLSGCAKCRDEAVDLADALAGDEADVSEDLHRRVLSIVPQTDSGVRRALAARATRRGALSQRRAARERSPIFVWMAAAAAAAFLLVLLLSLSGPSGTPFNVAHKSPAPRPDVLKPEPVRPEERPKLANDPTRGEGPRTPAPEPPKKEDPKPFVKDERKPLDPARGKPADPAPGRQDPPKPEIVKESPKPQPPKSTVAESTPKPEPKPLRYLALRVAHVNGVLALRSGKKVVKGMELGRQDEVFTDHRHLAGFALEGGISGFLEHGTSFSIEQPEGGETRLSLRAGTAFFSVEKRPQPFAVSTPCADAVVVGTAFQVEMDEKRTTLHVLEGTIRFKNPQGEVLVHAGHRSQARRAEKPSSPVKVDVAALTAWTRRPDLAGDPKAEAWIEHVAGANKKFPGLVIAAPYSEWETAGGYFGRATSEMMDVGLVLGHNHREREKKLWMNIDRGTEHEMKETTSSVRTTPVATDRARKVTADYLAQLKTAAGVPENRPVALVVDFRVHSEVAAGGADLEVCEVAWNGFGGSRKLIEQAKTFYAQLLDKHRPAYRMEMRFDGVDDSYSYKGQTRRFMFTESDAKGDGYMAAKHSQNSVAFFVNTSLQRQHAEDLETYAKVFAEMIEFLYARRKG